MTDGRRAVFLDVDGTYANTRGLVPASARDAVARARSNGHLVFLCTGRSMVELSEAILDAGFDGVVASAGAYVEIGGEVLAHRVIPVNRLRRAVEYFDSIGVDYYLQATGGVYASKGGKTRLRDLIFGGVTDPADRADLERGLSGILDALIVGADLVRTDITKASSFLDSGLHIDVLRREFAGEFDIIPATTPALGPDSGEMSLPGVHKASGIETVLEAIGLTPAEAVAFGDGANDVEMLEYVGVGIAMAGAHPAARAVADGETSGPDDDGITAGFAALGLI